MKMQMFDVQTPKARCFGDCHDDMEEKLFDIHPNSLVSSQAAVQLSLTEDHE